MKPAMTAGMSYSVVILLALVACVNARSFYEVLGVDRNATPRQLKKGYMNQVLKYHPDKNDSPDATDKFMEVTTAYECLGDPELRKKYDSIGHDAYVGSNQSDKKTQGKHEQQGDPFSKFESFFRSEQRSSSFDDDDEFFQNFFSEFDGMFESHGFGDGGPGFRSSKTFRRSGGGGIKIEMDGFMNMDDILFDPLWNGGDEEEGGDPSHFGSGRSFFGGGHFAPPAHQAHSHAPHSSAHARAHARAHQQHQNIHQQHQNMHQQHQKMHQQHQKMHQQQHNFHQQHHNFQHHHNFHHQNQDGPSKHDHPHKFHHQQEFQFFTSGGDEFEEDLFGEGMFGFSNGFSDSSFGPKEFHFESSSSSAGKGGGARSETTKTYSYETSSSDTAKNGVKRGGKQVTCKVSKTTDSMGNIRESKTCT